MSQVDVSSLKEILCAQQQLLQKLYNELDVEREASSSAASETLSMILRLQGEKAAVKMEAEQYKRLAEEKMCHAEESLEFFEDLIYQKEMEIAALDYQVQAYRYKLLSMGCTDPGVGEIKFPENLLQRNETLAGEMNLQALGRRNSAPSIPLKYGYARKGALDRDESTSPERDLIKLEECSGQEMNEQQFDLEKKTDVSTSGSIHSYFEQIRKLDDRVKEIAGVSYANLRSETRSPSPLSQRSPDHVPEPLKEPTSNETYLPKHQGNKSENGTPPYSPNVLDVFEVPQADKDTIDIGLPPKHDGKMNLYGEERLDRPDSVPHQAVKPYVKEGTDRIKKYLISTQREIKSRKASEAAAINCNLAIVSPTTSVSGSADVHQLNRRSEIVEVGREVTRQETDREEELKLLHEIKEQLRLMEYEIRSLKNEKLPSNDEPVLLTLKEAMIHFWL